MNKVLGWVWSPRVMVCLGLGLALVHLSGVVIPVWAVPFGRMLLCVLLVTLAIRIIRESFDDKSEKSAALNNPETWRGIGDSYPARSKEDVVMHASDDDRAALLWEREDMLEAGEKLIELKLPDVCVHHSEPWYCDSCKMELENKIRIQKVRVRDAITAYRRAG